MSIKPYPSYRPSGFAWINAIPEHWNPRPLKFDLLRNDGGVWGEDSDENGTIVLRSTEIEIDGGWKIIEPARRKLSAHELSVALLRTGDIVVTKSSGSEAHLGKSALVTDDIADLGCAFSNFMQRLRFNSKSDPKYIFYVLNNDIGREQLGYLGTTTTGLRNLSGKIIADVIVPGASLIEQQAISSFLDQETAVIDTLITKKQELIQRLHEKRTALISHAVTKGLDPTAPMKDSGIEWLGEIPAHWQTIRSKWLFTLRKTKAYPTDQQITVSQKHGPIYQEEFVDLEGRRVMEVIKGADILQHIEPGDFVISMRSFQGGIEFSKIRGSVSSAYVVLIPAESVHTAFFAHLLKSSQYIQALQGTTNLIRDGQAIRYSNFVLVDLPVVPIDEQRQIASYLNRETEQINVLVQKLEKIIGLLKEYRTALISAAVTGKIDVRDHGQEVV